MKIDFDALLKICDALDVDAEVFYRDFMADRRSESSISLREQELIKKYRVLDEHDKKCGFNFKQQI